MSSVTIYSNEEAREAKKLIKRFLSIMEKDSLSDDVERFFQTDSWKKYKHAVPSQFTFYFPFDNPDEVYNNHPKNVTNGLDSPLISSNGSFNVEFDLNPKYKHEFDYPHDLLAHGLLPDWLDFVDEDHLEATHTPDNFSVRDLIDLFLSLGFQHKPGHYECLFSKEIDSYLNRSLPLKNALLQSKP